MLTQYCSGDQIENEMGGACSTYGDRGEMYTSFWLGILRDKDNWEDPNVHGRIILRWIFRKCVVEAWTGSSWLRIGKGDMLLSMR